MSNLINSKRKITDYFVSLGADPNKFIIKTERTGDSTRILIIFVNSDTQVEEVVLGEGIRTFTEETLLQNDPMSIIQKMHTVSYRVGNPPEEKPDQDNNKSQLDSVIQGSYKPEYAIKLSELDNIL